MIEVKIKEVNGTLLSTTAQNPESIVVYGATSSKATTTNEPKLPVVSFNLSNPADGSYKLSFSIRDHSYPINAQSQAFIKIKASTQEVTLNVGVTSSSLNTSSNSTSAGLGTAEVPESLATSAKTTESVADGSSMVSVVGAALGLDPGCAAMMFTLNIKTLTRLGLLNLNMGGYIHSYFWEKKSSAGSQNSASKLRRRLVDDKEIGKKKRSQNYQEFLTNETISATFSDRILEISKNDLLVQDEAFTRGKLSQNHVTLVFPVVIMIKSILYNTSWLFSLILYTILHFIRRKGPFTRSTWIFYTIRLHKKIHFSIFVFVISDLAFHCTRTILHSDYKNLRPELRNSLATALLNIVLIYWDLAVILWESLEIEHDRVLLKYQRFMKDELSLKEIISFEDIDDEKSSKSGSSRQEGRGRVFNTRSRSSSLSSKSDKSNLVINIDRSMAKIGIHQDIHEFIRYELKNEEEIFKRPAIKLLAFIYLFKVSLYQILTVVYQNLTYAMIAVMMIYEASQLSVQVYYYCTVKHLKYCSLLMWRLIQSLSMLVFLGLSILISTQLEKKNISVYDEYLRSINMERVAVGALTLSMMSEYIFLVLNIYYVIKFKYWKCQLKNKLARFGKRYTGMFDHLLVYEEQPDFLEWDSSSRKMILNSKSRNEILETEGQPIKGKRRKNRRKSHIKNRGNRSSSKLAQFGINRYRSMRGFIGNRRQVKSSRYKLNLNDFGQNSKNNKNWRKMKNASILSGRHETDGVYDSRRNSGRKNDANGRKRRDKVGGRVAFFDKLKERTQEKTPIINKETKARRSVDSGSPDRLSGGVQGGPKAMGGREMTSLNEFLE